ncbi:MAG: CPBP family glutamic-type intramembrane protease [Defluviitaleaceae bacterium]|nr:CPBP family glutamic-type intramembrane protease [Defluviitaleaceae bacterium]
MKKYNETHLYYTKADGYLAIGIYVVNVVLLFLAARLLKSQELSLFVPFSILVVVLIIALLLFLKQNGQSIGISLSGLWQSALLGLALGGAFFFGMRIFLLGFSVFEQELAGARLDWVRGDYILVYDIPLSEWLPTALLFIIITVVHQEILMRGYVQTRLYGLIKSDVAVTCITAVMFVLLFLPMQSVLAGINIFWVLSAIIPLRLAWMLAFHIGLNFLHRAFNNLAAPIIFHIFFSFFTRATLVNYYYFGLF